MQKIYLLGLVSFAAALSSSCAASSDNMKNGEMKTSATAQDYIKPGAAIGHSHDLKKSYDVGETATFTLKLGESYGAGTLRVNITGEGVDVVATSGPTSFDMARGDEHEMLISFTVNANGRHYINVQAAADVGDGNPMMRAISLPVQVGPAVAQKPNVDMKTMKDGENIIEMEAQEEIK